MGKTSEERRTEVGRTARIGTYIRSVCYTIGGKNTKQVLITKKKCMVVNTVLQGYFKPGLTHGMCTVENLVSADTAPQICNVTKQINK
jgi:hypothetical protein